MKCTPLKDFPYSFDGIHAKQAVAGVDCEIPDQYVEGLLAEKYIKMPEVKDAGPAPENKDAGPAPKNKAKPKKYGTAYTPPRNLKKK